MSGDPVEELVATMTAMRQDINRMQQQQVELHQSTLKLEAASQRIASTIGIEAADAAYKALMPLAMQLQESVANFVSATKGTEKLAENLGKGIPKPLVIAFIFTVIVAVAFTFVLGWYFGPGDWRSCPNGRLLVQGDDTNKSAWCKMYP